MVMMDDVLYEILVRVDPYLIFNCIMVCKEWLEGITSSEFRRSYQKRWKSNSKLVGLISRHPCNCPLTSELKFLATSELGRIMDANRSESIRHGFFVSKSGESDGVILFGVLSYRPHWGLLEKATFCLYVSKIGENPIKLPQPPAGRRWAAPAILSRPDSSYKVILITHGRDGKSVDIHTFSSSTVRWVSFNQKGIPASPGGDKSKGIVSSRRGFVYWPWPGKNMLAMYDDSNQVNPICWINGPSYKRKSYPIASTESTFDYEEQQAKIMKHYGMSSQGYLLRATLSRGSIIRIWLLDDDKVWNMLHDVRLPPDHTFVSFFPATYDSIVVNPVSYDSSKHIQPFLYHLRSRELDKYSPPFNQGWVVDYGKVYQKASSFDFTPLTVADLGVWPSSPFSNSTKTNNIHGVKHILDPFVPLSAWPPYYHKHSHLD